MVLGSRAMPRHFVESKTEVMSTHLPWLRDQLMLFASVSQENLAGRAACEWTRMTAVPPAA